MLRNLNMLFIYGDMNLEPAIKYFGSQKALAKALEIDPMAITQWKRRGMPPRRAKQISELTGGFIKPIDLLPDFFGEKA